jgi:hypothetical protein
MGHRTFVMDAIAVSRECYGAGPGDDGKRSESIQRREAHLYVLSERLQDASQPRQHRVGTAQSVPLNGLDQTRNPARRLREFERHLPGMQLRHSSGNGTLLVTVGGFGFPAELLPYKLPD